jgi:hypothetical protein
MESERAIQRVEYGIDAKDRGHDEDGGHAAFANGDPFQALSLIHVLILLAAGKLQP